MNNQQLFHAFAHGATEGRNANKTLFIENDTLYSYGYHFPMITRTSHGFFLRNCDQYSATTAKQKSQATSACSPTRMIDVPKPNATTQAQHESNHAFIVEEYTSALTKAQRARANKAFYLSYASKMATHAALYARAYNIDAPVLTAPNETELARLIKEVEEKRKQAQLQKQLKREAEQLAIIDDWRAGSNRYPTGTRKLLRIQGDKIQTSNYAEIPLNMAYPLWVMVQQCRLLNEPYKQRLTVGSYTLTSIDTSGNITVDCHYIEYSELKMIADQLGYKEGLTDHATGEQCMTKEEYRQTHR